MANQQLILTEWNDTESELLCPIWLELAAGALVTLCCIKFFHSFPYRQHFVISNNRTIY